MIEELILKTSAAKLHRSTEQKLKTRVDFLRFIFSVTSRRAGQVKTDAGPLATVIYFNFSSVKLLIDDYVSIYVLTVRNVLQVGNI